MSDDLEKALAHVRDKALKRETPTHPAAPGSRGWEHGTIDGYLGAAAACATAHLDARDKRRENPWQTCARILFQGKFYE